MIIRKHVFGCIFSLFLIAFGTQSAHADLTILMSDDGMGGVNVEFMGSGNLVAGGDFIYGSTDDFIGFLPANDMFTAPEPVIAGGTLTEVTASPGGFFNPDDRIVIPDPGWVVGESLSTANGTVFNLPNFAFSSLTIGTYVLTQQGDADVGNVSLIVMAAPAPLKGDVNLDGIVSFLDINPFILLLSTNGFQAEADCDCDGDLDFLDIQPFIDILAGN